MTNETEEAYWFLRWIAMRYDRNKLKAKIQELMKLDINKVYEENIKLKKTLEEIRENYQPIKTKIHNGNPKRSKGYGRR